MKVLHILHELKFSGAEILYTDAAPLFQSWGCSLGVVATSHRIGDYAPVMKNAGFEVYHLPYPKNYLSRINFYRKLCHLIKRENYDVVHVHANGLRWGGSFCAWLTGRRCVSTFHSTFPTHWYSILWHIYLRRCAKYVFRARFQSISDTVFQNEKRRFLNNTHLIYNWYGSNRFYPAENGEKASVREQMGIDKETIVVVSVAGCREMKRHMDIIRAVHLLRGRNCPILYLHIGSGEYEEKEKLSAHELGLTDCIRFCGPQQDVRPFLIASDIYLMTSRYEGIPISTIEAMACGIPCILYDVPGLHDFNNDAECAVLIPESAEILAEKIALLAGDSKMQSRLIDNELDLVHRKYFMERNARQIYQLYQ